MNKSPPSHLKVLNEVHSVKIFPVGLSVLISVLPGHLLTSPLISAPGLEQLRNLRHLDVAYNLLERHRELAPLWLLTELRKVRTRQRASCPPPPVLSWSAPLLI